ncbi:GIP, partial [Symbiodinium sp. KB8]
MPSGDGDTGADDAPEVTDTEDPDEELLAERADGYLDEFLGEGDTLEGEEEAGFADDQPVEAAAELRTPVRQGLPDYVFGGEPSSEETQGQLARGPGLRRGQEEDAADYLEDIPAKTFGTKEGWKILLRVLKEKFDERRMHKVGSAMKGFFRLDVAGKNMTMIEVADAMDKAARRCKEAGLVIPDEVLVYFLFEHTNSSLERQANVLLRTSGQYNWKKVKQAIELLYPTVQVRSGREPGRDAHRDQRAGGRARGAHETRWEYDPEWRLPSSGATEEQVANWLLDHDPAEMIAEQDMEELPEDLAKTLHSVMATHRENRQKLARAVQARGFYVNGGKGKKGSKGGGGKGSGKGKAKGSGKSSKGGGKTPNGMTLDELKAVTVCGDCGQKGHWRGDAACNAKKVNEVARHEAEDDDYDGGADGLDDWYGYGEEGDDDQWMAERYGYVVARTVQAATRTTTSPPNPSVTRPSSTSAAPTAALRNEAARTARGVNKVRAKAGQTMEVATSAVEEALRSDDFFASEAVTRRIKEAHKPTMSRSSAPEAVENAMRFFGITTVSPDGGLRDFLQDSGDQDGAVIDLDKLRRSFPARRAHWMPGSSRSVLSNRRAPPEVEAGKDYLTIDTACENTVVGQRLLDRILGRWQADFGLVPKEEDENEFYCFGQRLTEPEPLAHQEKYTDLREISERMSQQLTHKYEPNLDDLNSDLQPFQCILPVDHWQFCVDSGMHVRHHLRPRTSLFELSEVADGPEARWLRGERVTVIHGVSEPLWDLWGTGAREQHLPVSWSSPAISVKDPNGPRDPSHEEDRRLSNDVAAFCQVMLLCDQIDRMEVSTNFVRSMRFRAPALTAYAEVMAEMETGHLLSVAPTNQKLQSKKAVNPNYPVNLYLCDHPEDASRRHGNKHGRYRDCLLCGMVFKAMAEDYHVPISEDK